ncbi:MalY/PatB family protein [Terrarubrum flagellatum]|uniref:MalY/PatB family protein n=1 Tax=Terrirubrum flagellatum TaxID=2895980 RepID=UPI003144D498
MLQEFLNERAKSVEFDRVYGGGGVGDSKKWRLYPQDILPMWVADMDFAVAEPIVEALRQRLTHPIFGYTFPSQGLKDAIVETLQARHGWTIQPSNLVFLPGVEPGVNMALKAILRPGDGVVVQTPAYRPLLDAPDHWGLKRIEAPLIREADGPYTIDKAGLEDAIGRAHALLLCNPHNPTGRVFTHEELRMIAEACERRNALIISDEIHSDLVFDGRTHIPIATLDPEVAARTITLMSGNKTFNIAGLKTAFAIIPNPALRHRFQAARQGMVDSVNLLGLAATEAAYRQGEEWRRALVNYLEANRNHLASELGRRFSGISFSPPEATFLAWLDCTALELESEPQKFFLEKARVGFSAGREFGKEGRGHVRVNFGAPRVLIDDALDRMEQALAGR